MEIPSLHTVVVVIVVAAAVIIVDVVVVVAAVAISVETQFSLLANKTCLTFNPLPGPYFLNIKKNKGCHVAHNKNTRSLPNPPNLDYNKYDHKLRRICLLTLAVKQIHNYIDSLYNFGK